MNDIESILAKLFSMYPNVEVSEGMVLGYIDRLQNIPFRELQAVVNQCIDECKFLPTVADIKEKHRQMHSPVSPDLAAQGWISVQRALRDPATYSPTPEGPMPKFKDSLVAKAVEALGWHNLRLSENQMADRAQFLKFYQMFANSEAGEQRLSPEYKQLREDNRRAVDELAEKQSERGFSNLKRIGMVLNGTNGGEN